MNIDFKLPELGENVHSGDVVNVLVQEGDVIEVNDGIVELETDKAVVEIPCSHAGRIAKLLVKKGDTIKVGQTIATIASGEAAEPAATTQAATTPAQRAKAAYAAAGQKAAAPPAVTATLLDRPGPIPAGPAVRRMAREQGIDLRTVAGSGKNGRIIPEDLQASAPSTHAAATPVAAAVAPSPARPTSAAHSLPPPPRRGIASDTSAS